MSSVNGIHSEINDVIPELKSLLTHAVEKNGAGGLLFSGGLDSAILAGLDLRVKGITVSLESRGKDIELASSAAKFLGIEHHMENVGIDEAMGAIPEVIKILGAFDPAIPNDLVVYFGLKHAKELKISNVMTGDGADEFLAGYSFMENIDALDDYIGRISDSLQFSSNKLGGFFDIGIRQPYLDRGVTGLCRKIKKEHKIKRENNRVWGKWILRKAFEDILPGNIIWQEKRPLEIGSGMTRIREIVSSRIDDDEFKKVSHSSSMHFINKEHYYYYTIYRKVVGDIPVPRSGEKVCPGCGTGINPSSFHCKVCGYVLDWRSR